MTPRLDSEAQVNGTCMDYIKNKIGRGQFFAAPFTVGLFEPKSYICQRNYHGGRCKHIELCTTWGCTLQMTPNLGSRARSEPCGTQME